MAIFCHGNVKNNTKLAKVMINVLKLLAILFSVRQRSSYTFLARSIFTNSPGTFSIRNYIERKLECIKRTWSERLTTMAAIHRHGTLDSSEYGSIQWKRRQTRSLWSLGTEIEPGHSATARQILGAMIIPIYSCVCTVRSTFSEQSHPRRDLQVGLSTDWSQNHLRIRTSRSNCSLSSGSIL